MLRFSSRLGMLLLLFGAASGQQEPSFSSQGNLVPVPTLVRDAAGNAVYGLRAQDFIIEDDGVEQAVHLDEPAEAEPISLVIAVQCGRRAKREFGRMGGLAALLDPILSGRQNEAALLLFDSKLNLVHDFTKHAEVIEEDLKNLEEGDHGAAILDAVAYSAKMLTLWCTHSRSRHISRSNWIPRGVATETSGARALISSKNLLPRDRR